MGTTNKVMYLLLSVIAFVCLLAGPENITKFFSASHKNNISLTAVADAFASLPAPPRSSSIQVNRKFDKGAIVGITGDFRSALSKQELIEFYLHTMPALGWKSAIKSVEPNVSQLKFCRNGLSLTYELTVAPQESLIHVGVVGTNFRRSKSYCA